jgi:ABC-type phosphate transport system substrate-binding protein
MPGHHARPGLRPRRSTYPVIAAAAAILVLAVTACSSATASTTASAVAATSIGPGGHPPTLAGAGSTFDEPFFAVAFAQYQRQHPGVTIGYSAVGHHLHLQQLPVQRVCGLGRQGRHRQDAQLAGR